MTAEQRNCIYCHEPFAVNKYSPRQKVCSKPACQHERQIESMKQWRQRNPAYFKYDLSAKGQEWINTQRERSRVWRQRNPDKIRNYRQTHMDRYRQYMREYMRGYRHRKKEAPQAAPSPSPQPTSSGGTGESSPSNPPQ